ncbi:CoA ester lyase [Streptomyces sp. Root264]|uniref:HpcH/HpaI aldolase/citrate lyase family protein n=1 Tax=Streptomyces sp. Root264 TaxID=1736503 RepID=UPI000ADC6B59|nr:aldolase/citrate lyase family protein [Streptomyces sp. Root264]
MNRPAPQPLRAWLITPALNADQFEKAKSYGADVALADLEDSVAPADKATARATAARFLHPAATSRPVLGLRVNTPVTADGIRDLAAITGYTHQPGIVLVPKVESARDIEVVAGALDTDQHAPVIYALIETPRAIDWLPTIVTADRLGGLLFGAADYAALTGCARTWEALPYARSAVANNAGTACIPAIDSPYFDVRDLEGLRREAERARALGFRAKEPSTPGGSPSSHRRSPRPTTRSPHPGRRRRRPPSLSGRDHRRRPDGRPAPGRRRPSRRQPCCRVRVTRLPQMKEPPMNTSTATTTPQGYREVGKGRFRENVGAGLTDFVVGQIFEHRPAGPSPRPTTS